MIVSIKTLFWATMMVALVIYISAVMLVDTVHESEDASEETKQGW
jgi:hypothetical protein